MGNVYRNAVVGATPNPLITDPDAADEAFAAGANAALRTAVNVARATVRAHQAAAAVVVDGDWSTARKYFSLSEKYADWAGYEAGAVGFGAHGWLLREPQVVRMTQADLEAHPQWRGFGRQRGLHPPMRGWLAVPLRDRAGKTWGLLQASDRDDGEFTAEDEAAFADLAALLSCALEALWDVRNAAKATA